MQKQITILLLIITVLTFANWHVTELQTGNPNTYQYRVGLKLSPDKKYLLSIGGGNATDHLLLYNTETGQEKIICDSVFLGDGFKEASWSADSKKILFWTRCYPDSGYADFKKYYIRNLETDETTFFKDAIRAEYSPVSNKIASIIKKDIVISNNETAQDDTVKFGSSSLCALNWSYNSDSFLYFHKVDYDSVCTDSLLSYNTITHQYKVFDKPLMGHSGQDPWGGGRAFKPYVENNIEKILYSEWHMTNLNDSLLLYNAATDSSTCVASHMNPHSGPWYVGEIALFPSLNKVIYQEYYISSFNAMPAIIEVDLNTGNAYNLILKHFEDYGTWPGGFGYPMEFATANDQLFYISALTGNNNDLTAHLFVAIDGNSINQENNKKSIGLTCYPNPFNPSTTISYTLKTSSLVKLSVYNGNGQIVHNITNANQTAGLYHYQFNAVNLTSGIYYLVLETADQRLCQKIMLIK